MQETQQTWLGPRTLASAGSFLLAISGGVLIGPSVAIAFGVLGAVLLAYGTESVRRWLPTVRIERNPGVGIRLYPPERPGRRRLRQNTISFAKEVNEWVATRPDTEGAIDRRVREISAQILEEIGGPQADPEERSRRMEPVFRQAMDDRSTAYRQQALEAQRLFAGRAIYLIGEYRRRGLVETDDEARRLIWEAETGSWIEKLVSKLEALAHRL
jgi:hypothetical protein